MVHPIILYDGICGLCNRFVQFILRRDRNAIFRFASLQSRMATNLLAGHDFGPNLLGTVYVVIDPGLTSESLLSRSDGALYVLNQLAGPWKAVAFLLQLLPKFIRDSVYDFVARHRYQIFGRRETCIVPNPEYRSRFLDL